MADAELMLRFLVQILIILSACRLMGWAGKKWLGQSPVVMEMITGIVLGPSVFGLIKPDWQTWVFPATVTLSDGSSARHPSMTVLYVVAQLGLILSMFLVGNEFDPDMFRQRAKGAMAVSAAGMAFPFLLGAAAALYLFGTREPAMFGSTIGSTEAALFLGASLCITAFPVLARILYDQGLTKTSIGTICLASGAINDASAWALLAVVLGLHHQSLSAAFLAIGGGLLFTVIMLVVGSRMMARMGQRVEEAGKLSQTGFTILLLILLAAAGLTEFLGIHAVFGAFVVGIIAPRGRFAREVRDKLEAVTMGCLVPCFFVYSGLNTQLGLLQGRQAWVAAGIIISAAVLGKGVGCLLAARAAGETWRNSAAIGTLMNARGLMELIIANIGLQLGIISPTLFAILALMAIATTVMTSPLFALIFRPQETVVPEAAGAFGRPS